MAALAGVEITLYPPQPPAAWFQDLLGRYRGRKVLIVGHSNTIPRLVEALGGPKGIVWGDDEYDRLLEITITENGTASLSEHRYGPTAGGP